jgi:hypothetical protein
MPLGRYQDINRTDPGGRVTPIATLENDIGRLVRVLAAEEDQNDACEDEMNALFEFLTTEPAICPTA